MIAFPRLESSTSIFGYAIDIDSFSPGIRQVDQQFNIVSSIWATSLIAFVSVTIFLGLVEFTAGCKYLSDYKVSIFLISNIEQVD
jgi:hypothetical protein